MSLIDKKNYYAGYVYFYLACLAQKEVRKFTKLLGDVMGEDNARLVDSLTDNIYSPDATGEESEFEKILRAHKLDMDWVDWSVKSSAPEADSVPTKRKVK